MLNTQKRKMWLDSLGISIAIELLTFNIYIYIYIYIYCDVFGRMPSLLGNRKLNTFMDTLATRYCRVAWLPCNHGRVFSIGTARCCKGKAIHNSEIVSLRNQCVSECSGSEKSVLGSESSKRAFAVRSQRLARVAVISRVRSFSVYLVVNCCVSSQQLQPVAVINLHSE
jgi:hypothetical protein